MCLTMGVIGSATPAAFTMGIIIGILGLIGVGVNYPIYRKMRTNFPQKVDIIQIQQPVGIVCHDGLPI